MGFVTPALLLIDIYDRLRRVGRPLWPVVALAVSLGSLGSFSLGYRFAPAVDCFRFPHPDLSAYPKFIGLMMVSYLGLRGRGWEPWSWSTGWLRMVGGWVLGLGMVAVLVYHVRVLWKRGIRQNRVSLIVTALMSFSLLFVVGTAVGRVCLGVEAAYASRYVPYLIPAWLALYFHILSLSFPRLKASFLIILCILLSISHFMRRVDVINMK
jgi:hypothetical protein